MTVFTNSPKTMNVILRILYTSSIRSIAHCTSNTGINDHTSDYNIEFAIGRDDDIYYVGRTVSSSDKEQIALSRFLEKLKKKIRDRYRRGKFKTTDDVNVYIEERCIDFDCFPIQNSKSYQIVDRMLFSRDADYILHNFSKKTYDSTREPTNKKSKL